MLSGCTVTGPAQDQWDIEESEGKLDLSTVFETDTTPSTVDPIESTQAQNTESSNVKSDYQEYLKFQEFLSERESSTPLYREFENYLLWLEARESAN